MTLTWVEPLPLIFSSLMESDLFYLYFINRVTSFHAYFPLEPGSKLNMHKTFSLRYVARGERSKPTFLIPMSFKKFVYLHILCMKINSLADDASELIILLEDL